MYVFLFTVSLRRFFFYVSIAASLERVWIFCDISATNGNWCARVILESPPEYNRNASCQQTSTRIQTWARFWKVPWTFRARKSSCQTAFCLLWKTDLLASFKCDKYQEDCEVWGLRISALQRYKGNCGTRNVSGLPKAFSLLFQLTPVVFSLGYTITWIT